VTVSGDRERDLARFEAMLDVFQRYLHSDELYRMTPVGLAGGNQEMVTLSIGIMLDLAESVDGGTQGEPGGGAAPVRAALARFERLRAANSDEYADKLRRELRSNTDAWRWYLDDCTSGAGSCADDYPAEVRKRLRIHGLLAEAESRGIGVDAERLAVSELDDVLRQVFTSDGRAFCGPKGEAGLFPEARFWWLYGRPAQ
jgi:hypothetical protein